MPGGAIWRKSANVNANFLRFPSGMLLGRKELPCKSGERLLVRPARWFGSLLLHRAAYDTKGERTEGPRALAIRLEGGFIRISDLHRSRPRTLRVAPLLVIGHRCFMRRCGLIWRPQPGDLVWRLRRQS
jgi:hypothetical protein